MKIIHVYASNNANSEQAFQDVSRLRLETLMSPTPGEWRNLKAVYGDKYTVPPPVQG